MVKDARIAEKWTRLSYILKRFVQDVIRAGVFKPPKGEECRRRGKG